MLCQVIHQLVRIQPEIGHDGIQANNLPSNWTWSRWPTPTSTNSVAIFRHYNLNHLDLLHFNNLKEENKGNTKYSGWSLLRSKLQYTWNSWKSCFHTLRILTCGFLNRLTDSGNVKGKLRWECSPCAIDIFSLHLKRYKMTFLYILM